MSPEPRPEAADAPPSVHGALDFGELQGLGLRPDDVLDFSANVNPYGPSPAVREALAGVPLDRYPDRECLELGAALRSRWACLPTVSYPATAPPS